jgi:hypothetical protein
MTRNGRGLDRCAQLLGRVRPRQTIKTFWPNVGSIGDYPASTKEILQEVQKSGPSRPEANAWVRNRYTVTAEFARKLLNVLSACGILGSNGHRYTLTPVAEDYLKSGNPDCLFNLLAERVLGFRELVALLESRAPLSPKETEIMWSSAMAPLKFARNQCPIRYNWLRGFGYASLVAHQMILTERGLKLASQLKVSRARTEQQRAEVSHNDLEDKVRLIGEFFEFEAKKRPSVNEALPTYALKFKEGDRQLDCLWVRYIPFAGKVKFPIEIQLGGNLADSIDRLETVAQYVQRGIIVTTEAQEKEIIDRLRVKRSPLLEKLTIIFVEDVYKAVEAASVLHSLAKRIFVD